MGEITWEWVGGWVGKMTLDMFETPQTVINNSTKTADSPFL